MIEIIIKAIFAIAQVVNLNTVYTYTPYTKPTIQPYNPTLPSTQPNLQNSPKIVYPLPQNTNNLPRAAQPVPPLTYQPQRRSNTVQNIQIYTTFPKASYLPSISRKGILLPILPSRTKIGYLNSNIIFLADQLLRNMDKEFKKYPVIVTTFVNLNNFKETSDLGRLLKENLVHELQVRGWKVIDINYMPKIVVNKYGEFVLTRDMKRIIKKYKVASILAGTYTVADNSLIVNAKIIDAKSGLIISTGQFEIPLEFVEDLLKNSSLKPVEIIVTGE